MQKSTKSGNSRYHLTIYWDKPDLYFSQSPLCHIPSLNVGYQDINNQGFLKIKLPPPLVYCDPAKTDQEITMTKKFLDGSKYLHQYLEEFSCIHPSIEGFSQIKPPPPPNLGNFPEITSPSSKIFQQSKAQQKKNPIIPWLSRNGKARLKLLFLQEKPM